MPQPSNSVSSNLRPAPPKNYYLKLLSPKSQSENQTTEQMPVDSNKNKSIKSKKKLNNHENKSDKKVLNNESTAKTTDPNNPELIIIDNIQCFSILSKTNGFLKKELEKQNEKYGKTLNYQKIKKQKENSNIDTEKSTKNEDELSILKLRLNKKEDTWSVEKRKKIEIDNNSDEKSIEKLGEDKNVKNLKAVEDESFEESALNKRKLTQNLSDNSNLSKNNEKSPKRCRKAIFTDTTTNELNNVQKGTTREISKNVQQKLTADTENKSSDDKVDKKSAVKFERKEPNITDNLSSELNNVDKSLEGPPLKKRKTKLRQNNFDKANSLVKNDEIEEKLPAKCENPIMDTATNELNNVQKGTTKKISKSKKVKPKVDKSSDDEVNKKSGEKFGTKESESDITDENKINKKDEEKIISDNTGNELELNNDEKPLKDIAAGKKKKSAKLASKKEQTKQTKKKKTFKKVAKDKEKTNLKITKSNDLKTQPKTSNNNKSRRGPIMRLTKIDPNKKSKNYSKSNLLHKSEIINKVIEEDKKKKPNKNEPNIKQFKSNASILKKMKERMETEPHQWRCIFCTLGENEKCLGFLYGPYRPLEGTNLKLINDISEIWIHSDCFIWSNLPLLSPIGVHHTPLLNITFDILNGALSSSCHHCNKPGATIACSSITCNKKRQLFHFSCAKEFGFTFIEHIYRVYCNNHSHAEILSQIGIGN